MKSFNVVSIAVLQTTVTVSLNINLATATTQNYSFPTTAVTNNVILTASEGALPYSYLWSIVSGDSSIGISSSTSSNVVWTLTTNQDGVYEAVWNCTVTDHNGSQTTSENVTVTITFEP
jgi:hypothetical protein